MKYNNTKRVMDVLISVTALVVLFPVLLLIAIAVKLESQGPVLFKQKRVGINKTTFDILKFRTMRTDTPKDVPTHLLENAGQYITKTGRALRISSLDELPQLYNVLKGEMSIVGPRPALWNQFDLIEARDRYGANAILPGLTGWAQINGRDELPIHIKAQLDGEYVERMNFFFDIKCLLATLVYVIKKEGVSDGGSRK